ncbi:glycosyltransferase family 8 protein [Herbaspirillum sp. SJZ099]|uniref:glycosyltransferase family 8 protein n=1 Tax=Herbaspirillum sp. SJZ099 TaxID=2572916 RepID=UPI0011A469AE|nr:glycosyltransferase [Herbaspirillum sp. SJZ099]TWC71361.1 UDP-glucose:(glucosyl)LPS alpha-1,3-glucosyltransferase [Herbaspirillum sp. SJZ099]
MNGERPTLHVAFGVDENFFRGAGVCIASILDNNPDLDLVFHVFTFGCSEQSRERLARMSQARGVPMHVHLLDEGVFARYRHNPRGSYSNAIFTRILMPGVLSGTTDRVLYVDADILCRGSLAELVTQDLGESVAAAAADVHTIAQRRIGAMGLEGDFYFNSGLLLIDVANWNRARITERAIELIGSGEYALDYPDQDALNKVAEHRVMRLHPKWNVMFSLLGSLRACRQKLRISDDAVMLHFGGPLKPWHNWSHGCAQDMFLRYQKGSGWADVSLDAPRTYKQMHQCATFHRGHGKYVQAMIWYGAYLRKKLSFMLQGAAAAALLAAVCLPESLAGGACWVGLAPGLG